MPGTDRHLRDGVIAGGILAAVTGSITFVFSDSIGLAVVLGIAGFIFTTAGSVFPDTDVKSSKPFRWIVSGGTATAVLVIGYLLFTNWEMYLQLLSSSVGRFIPSGVPMPVVGLMAVGLTIPVVKVGIAKGVDEATGSHRTRTYNPWNLIAVVCIVAGFLWLFLPPITLFGFNLRPVVALGVPGAFLVGAFAHIARDKAS